MTQYESLLNNIILLQELKKEDIVEYIKTKQFKLVSYKKNAVIHFEKEPCTEIEIIVSGQIVIEHLDKSGSFLIIAEFFSNDILGGNLLFSANPIYPMTISTKQDSTVLSFSKELLFKLFCKNPSFLNKYLEYVSDHTFILGGKIKQYANKTMRESLVYFLEKESKRENSKQIKLNMTKKALAEQIGVQRTSLSRELAKMRDEGLIIFDKESITII